MQNQPSKQKQKTDEDRDSQTVELNGFTAEELGEESAYDSTTEMAQIMRRGDESEGDPDERDVVGASNAAKDDRKPVPRYQRRADDQADKAPELKEN